MRAVPNIKHLCSLQICDEIGVKCPVNVKMFTGKSKLLWFVDKHINQDLHAVMFLYVDCVVILTHRPLWPPGGAAPSDRSASGLLEWESINDAMEALAMMNHYQMKNAGVCKTLTSGLNLFPFKNQRVSGALRLVRSKKSSLSSRLSAYQTHCTGLLWQDFTFYLLLLLFQVKYYIL